MSDTGSSPVKGSLLIITLLRDGVPVVFTASGRSMRPFVRDGDRLTVDPAAVAGLSRGDIGLYCYGEENLVAHRCLGPLQPPRGPGFRFRGDAVIGPVEILSRGQILGKVTGLTRDGRNIPLESAWRRLGVRLWLAGYPLREAARPARQGAARLAALVRRYFQRGTRSR